jgi:hypothetical protein
MAIQHSVSVRNARLDAIETTIGTAPILRLRSGAKPANCAASRTGTVLASLTLPSDWLTSASSGTKSKSGTWQDLSADASGTAGHYEIMDSGGTVCHEQGTVTATGGGGDMELDNTVIAAGQSITVTTYGLTEGNA